MVNADYDLLQGQAQALIEGEDDWVAITANLAALLFNTLDEVNFAGFYRMKDGELILAPFQGQVACVHIKLGNGVCGTVVQQEKTIVVPNVHEFAGHIACDTASNSEIVVPVFKEGQLWGVLDIDSPKLNRFNEADQTGLEGFVKLIFN